MQPDVIVRLPQGKDVVIDAKMTLVAYERYFNAEDDYTREAALQEHIASVRNHMRLLGRKDYQQLRGCVRSPAPPAWRAGRGTVPTDPQSPQGALCG